MKAMGIPYCNSCLTIFAPDLVSVAVTTHLQVLKNLERCCRRCANEPKCIGHLLTVMTQSDNLLFCLCIMQGNMAYTQNHSSASKVQLTLHRFQPFVNVLVLNFKCMPLVTHINISTLDVSSHPFPISVVEHSSLISNLLASA